MNDRSFEEIKSLFFNNLYFWTAAYASHLVINYHDFFCSVLPY